MDSEMPYFIGHYASSTWCNNRYTVYSGLVSCRFYAIPIIIPFLIYEIFHLLVASHKI